MKKIIIVLMLLALSVGMVGCGGGGSGSSANPGGEKKGVPSVVQLLSTHSIAQTNSTVYLHTKVLDGNGVPVKNEAVTYTNLSEPFGVIKSVLNFLGIQKPLGLLSATVVKTNNLGIATAKLTSTTAGFATIQAEVNTGAGQVRDKRTIFFTTSLTPPTPPSPTIRLHVYDSTNDIPDEPDDFNLFKGGNASDNRRSIKAVVKDGFGRPVSGATIFFGSDSPSNVTFSGNLPLTNADGEAVVVVEVTPFAADQSFELIVNITAQTTVNSINIGNMVSLFLKPGPVIISSVTVNANPSIVATNGTSTVLATVIMLGALPVPDGTAVAFETTCGFIIPFAQTTNAVASATFTAPSVIPPGPCTVTATVGGISGSTDITITASTPLAVIPSVRTIGNPAATDTADFTILGGIAPYKAFSNNPVLVSLPENVAGDTVTATVESVPSTDTTVTITIYDSVGTSVSAQLILDVPPILPMAVIPRTQTLSNPIVTQTAEYQILGGIEPYSAFSNNPAVAVVSSIAGSVLTVEVASLPSTDTTVGFTIYDSVGSSTTASLVLDIVPTDPLDVLPSSITLAGLPAGDSGDNVTFFISGGSGTYIDVVSNNTAVIPNPTIAGNQFTIDPNVVATSTIVTLTVQDSTGATDTTSVTVTPATSSLGINPSSIAVYIGESIPFHIIGGVPPYDIFTNNAEIIDFAGATSIQNTFLINFTADAVGAGPAVITVVDSDARTITATVTVAAPAPPTVQPLAVQPGSQIIMGTTGGIATYTIFDGVPPYSVFSNNPAFPPSTPTVLASGGTFSLTVPPLTPSGAVTLTVRDSVGTTQNATLTIAVPTITFSIIPATFDIGTSAGGAVNIQYFVSGGVAPYQVFFALPMFIAAASPTQDGDIVGIAGDNNQEFTVRYRWNAGDEATFQLIVVDSLGSVVSSTINMSP